MEESKAEEMENYIRDRARQATWKFWEDDEEMMGSWFMGFAISIWKQNHKQEMEGFRQDWLKKVKISA